MREDATMKIAHLQLALPVALLLGICSGLSGARSSEVYPPRADRGLQGKIQYCTACHGASGGGYQGYYTMPRLAGQTTEYLKTQLRAFIDGNRGKTLVMRMSRVHGVSPEMQMALAAYFKDLNPSPFGDGSRSQAVAGKRIYDEGVPEANVPACAACHGPNGQGAGPNPRLAGQLYFYTVKSLANWTSERGQLPSARPMQATVQNLSRSQIAAVAAYLSHLK
jgi:cytochrome c553